MSMEKQCMRRAMLQELHWKIVLAKSQDRVGLLHILRVLESLGMGLDG